MKQNYTQSSLIQFIYDEVSTSERLAISEAIRRDPRLRREYLRLKAAQAKLPRAKFNAPKSAINRILDYSKSTAFEGAK